MFRLFETTNNRSGWIRNFNSYLDAISWLNRKHIVVTGTKHGNNYRLDSEDRRFLLQYSNRNIHGMKLSELSK